MLSTIEIKSVSMHADGSATVRATTRLATVDVHFGPSQVEQLAGVLVHAITRARTSDLAREVAELRDTIRRHT